MENRLSQLSERFRNLWFLVLLSLTLLLFWPALRVLLQLSLSDDRYSHIILIPVITACIIYSKRGSVFSASQYCITWGVPVLIIGLLVYCSVAPWRPDAHSGINLSLAVFAITVVWMSGFLLFFGRRAARAAIFPLFFLFLMIPIPVFLLANAVSALQQGSAAVTAILFRLSGVPMIQHGLRFSLPGVDIEIAEQCSGIRSSLSLFITGMLASYLLLQSTWKRILFSLLTVPVAIFKNGVRIVTLSWLGVYVNQGFLHGRLHQYGGLPVSVLALAILAPVFFALRKSESGFKSAGHA